MKKLTALFALVLITVPATPAFAAVNTGTSSPLIRVTPPAPKFTDAERHAELARRRSEVAGKMVDNSVLVLFSAQPKLYTNDVDYVFRQENNLFYLTNLAQAGATLVMTKSGGTVREFVFLPKRNPQLETWNGKMYSTEQAAALSGIKTFVDSAEREEFLKAVKEKRAFASKSSAGVGAEAHSHANPQRVAEHPRD